MKTHDRTDDETTIILHRAVFHGDDNSLVQHGMKAVVVPANFSAGMGLMVDEGCDPEHDIVVFVNESGYIVADLKWCDARFGNNPDDFAEQVELWISPKEGWVHCGCYDHYRATVEGVLKASADAELLGAPCASCGREVKTVPEGVAMCPECAERENRGYSKPYREQWADEILAGRSVVMLALDVHMAVNGSLAPREMEQFSDDVRVLRHVIDSWRNHGICEFDDAVLALLRAAEREACTKETTA